MSFQASSYVLELTEAPDGYKLNSTDKSVLHVLANNHNPVKRKAYPGVEYIAVRACCSETTAKDALKRMEEHLVIERIRPEVYGRTRTTDYVLLSIDAPQRLKEKLESRQKGDIEQPQNEPVKGDSDAPLSENHEGVGNAPLLETQEGDDHAPLLGGKGSEKGRERVGKGSEKGSDQPIVIRKNLEPRTLNLEPDARDSGFDAEKYLNLVNDDWVRPEQDTTQYRLESAWASALDYELKNGCTTPLGAVTLIRGRVREIAQIIRSTWSQDELCKVPRLATLLADKRYHEADAFWRRTPKPGSSPTSPVAEITAAERLRMSLENR